MILEQGSGKKWGGEEGILSHHTGKECFRRTEGVLEGKVRRPLWMERGHLGEAVGAHLEDANITGSPGPHRPLGKRGVSSARVEPQKGLSRAWYGLTYHIKRSL